MKLNEEIIFEALSKSYKVSRSGPKIQGLTLSRPMYLSPNTSPEEYKIYVGSYDSLSRDWGNVRCLFISLGQIPPRFRNGRSTFITVDNDDMDANISDIFNCVQAAFDYYDAWSEQLYKLLRDSCDIKDILKASAPVIKKHFCITNAQYEVEYLCVCAPPDYEPVFLPSEEATKRSETILNSTRNRRTDDNKRQEPFIICFNTGDTIQNVYNINIYKHNTYLSTFSLVSEGQPLSKTDMLLFTYLYDFIAPAVIAQSNYISGHFITIKNIFNELVSGTSVSEAIISKVTDTVTVGDGRAKNVWVCSVMRCRSEEESLPESYIGRMLESSIPGSVAICYENNTVLFTPIADSTSDYEELCGTLSSILKAVNFSAGVSDRFPGVRQARQFYKQAELSLRMGSRFHPEETVCRFSDHALNYMIMNSAGDMLPEFIVPRELMELWKENNSEADPSEWKILDCYLNNEMNLTRTAEEMYFHRSTLQSRVKKIEDKIDLESPEARLYTRMCMALFRLLSEEKQ